MSDWLFLCGILSGITTWLFGFGGGFVTVPLLYLLATGGWGAQSAVGQQAMQIAVATSALVMFCSALLATWRHARTGTLSWRRLWAMLTGIAVGGIAGALLALQVSGEWIRWLFVIYLLATIIDCYLRAGFMTPPSSRVVPTAPHELTVGGVIGLIASFLGVGGSVMTVPLMRRRGVLMSEAAAMANLLTLPLAATATLTWLVMAWLSPVALPAGFVGNIWLSAAAQLVAGSWLGLKIASRWLARLPDRWHVRIYPLLLIAVLLVMSVWG
ncbi:MULTISPECIES: sulfite exporter TauE/SafE family protein [Klebsiella]|uniref:sulfite exporter TauE/SafE family protein n=1 Tax=Klebsiella TaxID=570 RepID=UPI0011E44558|nr:MULTISPECIES: sulfite exporter TauE/SafE family protein [Klebsiella]MBD0903441.1 sulfite exporter TauE/SafE family protein [Klebsiella grimontii]MBZ7223049.1 sulfite exporter TauE/SafE family protein [Klebsiella grimontii]MBZ7403845.1 sulfite exporter TauE/SafE family protein [Klebsiella grimontii]MDM6723515.1 sulfite exporter TauE/SafE family protein [Klebsiella grimontii]MDM7223668.1 sulfite exporter TauE/SafE family protein [Klebsiella grimontii]